MVILRFYNKLYFFLIIEIMFSVLHPYVSRTDGHCKHTLYIYMYAYIHIDTSPLTNQYIPVFIHTYRLCFWKLQNYEYAISVIITEVL